MVLVVLFVFVVFILDGRYDFAARRVDFHFHDLLVLDYFHIERRLILVMLVLGMDSLASNVLLGAGYTACAIPIFASSMDEASFFAYALPMTVA